MKGQAHRIGNSLEAAFEEASLRLRVTSARQQHRWCEVGHAADIALIGLVEPANRSEKRKRQKESVCTP